MKIIHSSPGQRWRERGHLTSADGVAFLGIQVWLRVTWPESVWTAPFWGESSGHWLSENCSSAISHAGAWGSCLALCGMLSEPSVRNLWVPTLVSSGFDSAVSLVGCRLLAIPPVHFLNAQEVRGWVGWQHSLERGVLECGPRHQRPHCLESIRNANTGASPRTTDSSSGGVGPHALCFDKPPTCCPRQLRCADPTEGTPAPAS